MENWSLSMDNWLFSKQPKWTIIYLFEIQNMWLFNSEIVIYLIWF